MLAVLGDIHFRADYPWFIEAAENFLKWFKTWSLNNSNNELLLLGDLVEKPTNGGIVIDFLERLYAFSNFSQIHIIVGNHDFKRVDKVYQLAYEFYKRKADIKIYADFTKINIEGLDVAILPFLNPSVEISYPYKYYSKLKFSADIIFGHIQDKNFPGEGVANLEKKAKHICLGHIHSRIHKNYLGSLYPSNYSQNGPRYFRTYQRSGTKVNMKEIQLPTFLDFKIINYGEDPIKDNALTSVYVIHGGPAENLMDSKYKSLYIKKYYKATAREAKIKAKLLKKSTKEYFFDFLKNNDSIFNRNTIKICKEALNI